MSKMIEFIKKFLKEINTDALGRIEIKNVLGVPIIIVSVVYGIASKDWVGFTALFTGGVSLLFGTAVTDAKIDKAQLSKDVPYAT